MLRVRSSRRATSLKPSDYDHEINLFDEDVAREPRRETPDDDLRRESTTSNLISPVGEASDGGAQRGQASGDESGNESSSGEDRPSRRNRRDESIYDIQERPVDELQQGQDPSLDPRRPSIEVHGMETPRNGPPTTPAN